MMAYYINQKLNTFLPNETPVIKFCFLSHMSLWTLPSFPSLYSSDRLKAFGEQGLPSIVYL